MSSVLKKADKLNLSLSLCIKTSIFGGVIDLDFKVKFDLKVNVS